MKSKLFALALAACAVPALALAQPAAKAPAKPAPAEPSSYAEIKQVFGFVPTFFKTVPPELANSAWMEFKGLYMEETALPAKVKDMISVAVSSQIPCRYCVYADSAFAKFDGATPQELREAVMMAALTRKFSTILNGSLQDEAQFRKEIDSCFGYVNKMMAAKKAPPMIEVKDSASALKDIQGMLGSVPSFLKRVPEKSLAGAWLQMKMLQFNPNTALSGKNKELIGVAVAAQIPCRYCLHAHREAAKMNGATETEIDEAIAIAASTRQWSAMFYGSQLDEKVFQQEVNKLLKALQKQMQAAPPK